MPYWQWGANEGLRAGEKNDGSGRFYNLSRPLPLKDLEMRRGWESWCFLPSQAEQSPPQSTSHHARRSSLPWFLQQGEPLPEKGIIPIPLDTPSPEALQGSGAGVEACWGAFPAFISIPEQRGHGAWGSSTLGNQSPNCTDREGGPQGGSKML